MLRIKLLSCLLGCVAVLPLSAEAASYYGSVPPGFGGPIDFTGLTLADNGRALAGVHSPFLSNDSASDAGIGLVPDSGQSLLTLGSFDENASGTGSGSDAGVQAWDPLLQSTFGSYTVVPEPESLKLFIFAAVLGSARFLQGKRRKG